MRERKEKFNLFIWTICFNTIRIYPNFSTTFGRTLEPGHEPLLPLFPQLYEKIRKINYGIKKNLRYVIIFDPNAYVFIWDLVFICTRYRTIIKKKCIIHFNILTFVIQVQLLLSPFGMDLIFFYSQPHCFAKLINFFPVFLFPFFFINFYFL